MPDKKPTIKIGVLGAPHVGKTALLKILATSLTAPDTVPLRLEYGARLAYKHRHMYLVWDTHACELFTHGGDQKDLGASLRILLEESELAIWMVRLDHLADEPQRHACQVYQDLLTAIPPPKRLPLRWCVLFHGDLASYGDEKASTLVPPSIRSNLVAAYHVADLRAPTASRELFALLDGLISGKAD